MGILTKRLNNLIRDDVRKDGLLFDNQIDCAIKILASFDDDEPRCNHIILKGKTQSGKTGVFTSLYNIIIQLNLAKTMDINKIIYLTGDNSTGLPKQTKDRIERDCFIDANLNLIEQRIPIHILKNEDCKNKKKNKENRDLELKNSLIFLDESHYGTSKNENVINEFLSNKGIDLKNRDSLVEKNLYIISSSATPYNEMRGDLIACKKVVLLEPGNDYIGITDFEKHNVLKPISKDNKNEIKDIDSLNLFLEKSYETLYDTAELITHKRKCCIIRLSGKKKLTEETIEKICKKNKFKVSFFNSKKGNIDYSSIEKEIALHCESKNSNFIKEDEFLLIVINGAYRMGISINNYAKNYIGVLYDYCSNTNSIETTEQGLLGRMCGYWDSEEWRTMKIYSNKNHIKSLVEFYNKFNILNNDEDVINVKGYDDDEEDDDDINVAAPNIYKSVTKEKEISVNDGIINEESNVKCFGINDSPYEYDVSDFMKNNYTEEELLMLKKPDKLKACTITNIVKKYVDEKSKDETYFGKYKDAILVEAKRYYDKSNSQVNSWVNSIKCGKIISSGSRKNQLTKENVGKYGYVAILDLIEDDKYIILIRFGEFKYSEKITEDIKIDGKICPPYNTVNT